MHTTTKVSIAPPRFCASAASGVLAAIDTFVVVCMENRSFDHYLGALALEGRADVDGLTGAESNRAHDGRSIGVFRSERFDSKGDPRHDWDGAHLQWNGGRNDGFLRATTYDGAEECMSFHDRANLPVTYALADA